MKLDDPKWATLEGAYKTPFDASKLLSGLYNTNDKREIDSFFSELWDELHHQGDVGHASYFAVPILIQVCVYKKSLDWNYIGLILTIEICRHKDNNPILVKEFEEEYLASLVYFKTYLIENLNSIYDPHSFRLVLAYLAVMNNQIDLGSAIRNLEGDVLKAFVDTF